MSMATWRCPKCGGVDEVTAAYDGPINCGECLMARAEVVPMHRGVGIGDVVRELEKADKVIAVMMAHINSSLHMTGEERINRVADDLAARGLSEHQTSRWQLLREVAQ